MYSLSKNKWISLGRLNLGRQYPGSILLKSKRAFCFCGELGSLNYSNEVETIQSDTEWKILPYNRKVRKTQHLAAVSWFNLILVFGGR